MNPTRIKTRPVHRSGRRRVPLFDQVLTEPRPHFCREEEKLKGKAIRTQEGHESSIKQMPKLSGGPLIGSLNPLNVSFYFLFMIPSFFWSPTPEGQVTKAVPFFRRLENVKKYNRGEKEYHVLDNINSVAGQPALVSWRR